MGQIVWIVGFWCSIHPKLRILFFWKNIIIFSNINFRIVLSRAGEPEPEPVGAGCFWLLEAGAGAAWKKIRSRSRSRCRSRLQKSQEPEPLKNLPAPQPWSNVLKLYTPDSDICRDCAELCRLYHAQGQLEAATDLIIEYLEAVQGHGGEYFGLQHSLQANTRSFELYWFVA